MGEREENNEPHSGHFEMPLAVKYSSGDPAGSWNSSKTLTSKTRTEV